MRRSAWGLVFLLACIVGCQSPVMSRGELDAGSAGVLGDVAVRVTAHDAEAVDAGEPVPGTLTLVEAIRRAVLHDPRLQGALARVRAAEAGSLQARLLPNPILNVSMRLPEAGVGSPIVDVGLAMDLISLLRRPRTMSAADARLRGAVAEVLTTLADVVVDVEEAYAGVQTLGDVLVALDERRGLAERLVVLGRRRVEAGEASRLDVMALETQRMSLDVDVDDRRRELVATRLTLANLIGEPSSSADWTLERWAAPEAARAPEQAWVEVAMRRRAEVRAKEWELAALGDEIALTRLAIFEGSDIGVQAERDQTWSVGPALNTPLPVFDWGQAKYGKASAELAAARHQMTQLQRQVVQEVRTQYDAYNGSLQTLWLARDQLLPLQERRAAQAEASYRAGDTDVANLLLAQEDLLDTRVKVIELQKKSAVARIKLQRAVGGMGVAAEVEASAATRPSTTRPAATTTTTTRDLGRS